MKLITKIYFLLFFSQIYFIYSKDPTNNQDLEKFNAVYRIDSKEKNYPLIIQNNKVEFSTKKEGKEESFRILSVEDNNSGVYYIISKPFNKKLGVNEKNELILYDTYELLKTKWNFIKINAQEYLIQNDFNKKYLEIKNRKEGTKIIYYAICSNDVDQNLEPDKIKNIFKYSFFKLCEEVQFKPEHLKFIDNEPIDILIKYIDLTDKNLKRDGIKQIKKDEDNEELKYSVRSILQYIPWVRKIIILMPNERVKYFKPIEEISGKIVYVKDKDFLGFDSANSVVFQLNLYNMTKFGISENFILMDDDYFFGKPIKKSDFFYYDELEKKVFPAVVTDDFTEMIKNDIINEYNKLYKRKNTIQPHNFFGWKISQLAAFKLLLENYESPLINAGFSHNAIPLNIYDLKEMHDLIVNKYQYAKDTLYSKIRTVYDLQPQSLFNSFALNVKKRKVNSIPSIYYDIAFLDGKTYDIEMFVLNTSGDRKYTDSQYKKAREILEKKYPLPTPFETNEVTITNNKKVIDLNDYVKKTEYNNLKKEFEGIKEINKELDKKLKDISKEKNEIEKNLNSEIDYLKNSIKELKYSHNLTINNKNNKEETQGQYNSLKLIIDICIVIAIITLIYLCYTSKSKIIEENLEGNNIIQMSDINSKQQGQMFSRLSTEEKP